MARKAAAEGDASDATLARRVRAGDRTAEAELYRRLAPRVRAYGRRHLGDAAAADDLAQQVMLRVIEHLREGRMEQADKIHSFTLSTCRLTVKELRRRTARRRSILEAAAPWLAEAAAASAADLPSPVLDRDRLAACFERLDPRARSVIVAAFFAEEPAESIGRSLRTTAGHVRVVKHRALRDLHACVTGAP
ncbi:MAG: RNA polymerase sigma factor [Myxococcota bacterium]